MKPFTFASLALFALPLVAQAPQTTPDAQKPVAVINGEVITAGQLDHLYDRIGAQMREQYAKTGGKPAFLENYLRKRLVVQEALKANYDKRPDVQADLEAAKESALFDRYVRDIVAAPIVNDSEIAQYYKDHPDDFSTPEQVKVRHIVIGPRSKSREEALEQIQKVLTDLHAQDDAIKVSEPAATQMRLRNFAEMARKYSQDASADSGGDLGWVSRGQLDPTFEEAAFQIRKGRLSGVIQTNFGYHIIFVEDKRAAGTEPFDQVKASIREFLLNQRAADVLNAVSKLTNELRANSKIALYPENIK
jgi:EpsD family peptidyl-prolyl cis-trans isomerase